MVCPVYAAGEEPLEGLDHHKVAEGLRTHGQRSVVAVEDLDEAVKHLREEMKPGDIVITLGAGNVNRICDDLLEDAP